MTGQHLAVLGRRAVRPRQDGMPLAVTLKKTPNVVSRPWQCTAQSLLTSLAALKDMKERLLLSSAVELLQSKPCANQKAATRVCASMLDKRFTAVPSKSSLPCASFATTTIKAGGEEGNSGGGRPVTSFSITTKSMDAAAAAASLQSASSAPTAEKSGVAFRISAEGEPRVTRSCPGPSACLCASQPLPAFFLAWRRVRGEVLNRGKRVSVF